MSSRSHLTSMTGVAVRHAEIGTSAVITGYPVRSLVGEGRYVAEAAHELSQRGPAYRTATAGARP